MIRLSRTLPTITSRKAYGEIVDALSLLVDDVGPADQKSLEQIATRALACLGLLPPPPVLSTGGCAALLFPEGSGPWVQCTREVHDDEIDHNSGPSDWLEWRNRDPWALSPVDAFMAVRDAKSS